MNANVVTVVVVTASAILNYLLTQPAGTFSPQMILVIGALSIGLTTLSRFLPTTGATQKVEVTTPIEVTPVAAKPPAIDDGGNG